MTASDWIAIGALAVSFYTAYKTFVARFLGKVCFSNRLVLTHLDGVPAIGLACSFENLGAKLGSLDDLRLVVKHNDTGAVYYFYPQMMRHDYNIYSSYEGVDWFPFNRISLSPRQWIERYVLFRPLNDRFTAEAGDYNVMLESRWHGEKEDWQQCSSPALLIPVTNERAMVWNDKAKKAPSVQVLSNDVLEKRRIF